MIKLLELKYSGVEFQKSIFAYSLKLRSVDIFFVEINECIMNIQ